MMHLRVCESQNGKMSVSSSPLTERSMKYGQVVAKFFSAVTDSLKFVNESGFWISFL